MGGDKITPLVLSVDGVRGEETKSANKQLAAAYYNKWYSAYSATCGYVCASLSLNLVWSLILLVLGPRRVMPQTVRQMPEYGVEASIIVMRGY